MKAPLSWIKEYVDITEDMDTLCKRMVSIGLEIEEVQYLGDKVKNVVVCQIKSIKQHPNADRLRCCEVDIGDNIIPIVTNATNVKEGDKVPVALHDSYIADGTHITKGKMRGEPSDGMFCGIEELGITADWYDVPDEHGVLVLNADAVIGQDIRKEVGLDDYVIDVAVTSNRQDCNSVYGLAREIAVALGKQVRPLELDVVSDHSDNIDKYVDVRVEAQDLCPDYHMQGVKDVVIQKSPVWMTRRLAKVGLRGINNFVDITNYVLMEVGQPMHAFDYQYIKDKHIVVRRARQGETIVALDGKEYSLNENNLVIADNNDAVGLAGIMGGLDSGIKDSTTAVMFEAARFAKDNIRHSSRQLGLRSDSSARFERGIDSYTTVCGLNRALNLVNRLQCGTVIGGQIAVSTSDNAPKVVSFDKKRIKQLLGITISDKRIKQILESLQFGVAIEGKTVTVTVPPYRVDIDRDCDIIEELIRVYGYDNIKGTMMQRSHITKGGKSKLDKSMDSCRNMLCGLRYDECIFYPFAGEALYNKLSIDGKFDLNGAIRLSNPLGEELSLMNISLVPNMMQCVALNHSRKNYNVRLYELGKVYIANSLPLSQLPLEKNRLCMAASEDTDFDTFKKDVLQVVYTFVKSVKLVRSNAEYLHPGMSADILVGDRLLGSIGKLHPTCAKQFEMARDVYVADIDYDALMELNTDSFVFRNIPKFPSIQRDFALVMDEQVPVQDILDDFSTLCPLSESVKLFDIYRSEKLGADKKSLAISVVFRAKDRTLADSDIEKQVKRCLSTLEERYGAVLRAE